MQTNTKIRKTLLSLVFVLLSVQIYGQLVVDFELSTDGFVNPDTVCAPSARSFIANISYNGVPVTAANQDEFEIVWTIPPNVAQIVDELTPTVSYGSAGEYDVTLYVKHLASEEEATRFKTKMIKVFDIPNAAVKTGTFTACEGISFQFEDESTSDNGNIEAWNWQISGAGSSNQQNPNFTFNNPGDFGLILKVRDQVGCEDTLFIEKFVKIHKKTDKLFSWDPKFACEPPLSVSFNAPDPNPVFEYNWLIDGQLFLDQEVVNKTFNSPGRFTSSLSVRGPHPNCDTSFQVNEAVVIEKPNVDFEIVEKTCVNLPVKFKNISVGGINYVWDFGDGSSLVSDEVDIEHVFTSAGSYSVKLKALTEDNLCNDSISYTVELFNVIPAFSADDQLHCKVPSVVNFDASASDAPPGTTYSWDFSAGTGSGQTTSHSFPSFGKFKVILKLTSPDGCERQLSKNNYIEIRQLKPKLVADTVVGCEPLEVNFNETGNHSPFNVVKHEWNFDDGSPNVFVQSPTHTFNEGVFNIQATIETDEGCLGTSDVLNIQVGTKAKMDFYVEELETCAFDTTLLVDTSYVVLGLDTFYDIFNSRRWEIFIDEPNKDDEAVQEFGGGKELYLQHRYMASLGLDTSFSVRLITNFRGCLDTLVKHNVYKKRGPISVINSVKQICDGDLVLNGYELFADTLFWIDKLSGDTLSSKIKDTIPASELGPPGAREILLVSDNDSTQCIYRDSSDVQFFDQGSKQIFLISSPYACKGANNAKVRFRVTPPLNGVNLKVEYQLSDGSYATPGYDGGIKEYSFTEEVGCGFIRAIYTPQVGSAFCDADTLFREVCRYQPKPDIVLTSALDSGCAPFDVSFLADTSFSDNIDVNSVEWNLEFGGNGAIDTTIRDDFEAHFNIGTPDKYTVKLRALGEYRNNGSTVFCIASNEYEYVKVFDFKADFALNKSRYCIGDSLEISDQSEGDFPYFYKWKVPELNDSSTAVLPRFITEKADTLSVVLEISDSVTCYRKQEFIDTIIVDPSPVVDFSVENPSSNCPPANSRFFPQVTPQNFPDYAFTWYIDDSPVNTLDTTFITFKNAGVYGGSLVVETPAGCKDSLRKESLVNVNGPRGLLNILRDTVCPGDSVEFQLLNGQSISEIRWVWGDGSSSFSASPNDTIKKHAYNTITGSINVDVYLDPKTQTNPNGCNVRVNDSLFVNEVLSIFTLSEDSLCEPGQVTIDTVSYGIINRFDWNIEPLGINLTDSTPVVLDIQTPGQYDITLSIIDTNSGCQHSSTQLLWLFPPTPLTLSDDSILCAGETLELVAGGADQYNWTDTSGLGSLNRLDSSHVIANPKYSTMYYVEGVDSNLCRAMDSVIVFRDTTMLNMTFNPISDCGSLEFNVNNQSSEGEFSWDMGDGTGSDLREPSKTYTTIGNYFVSVEHYNLSPRCKQDTFQLLTVYDNPSYTKEGGGVICLGESANIKVTGGDVIFWTNDKGLENPTGYEFTTSPDQDVNYYFRIVDTNLCESIDSIAVLVDNPVATFNLAILDSCDRGKIRISDASNAKNHFFDMDDGSQLQQNVTDYILGDTGTYFIQYIVYDRIQRCADTAIKKVVVYPPVLIETSEDDSICNFETITLSASGGLEYQWWPSNNILSDTNNSSVIVQPDSSTVFNVRVKNQFDCYDTAQIYVKVWEDYLVDTIPDTTITIGDSVSLELITSKDVMVEWSPTTYLSCSDCYVQDDIFTLKDICYEINLVDSQLCYPKTIRPCIFIEERYSLDVPTGFTPNGDRINDVVYVDGWGIKELLEYSIFNRWGERVFFSDDLKVGWDGTYKGSLQNDENYVYVVKALMWNGEIREKTGYLTLLK